MAGRRRRPGKTTGDLALEIIGDLELVAKLNAIGKTEGHKIGRRAVRKGLTVIASAERAAVPPATTPGHSNRRIKKSIGSRLGRVRRSGGAAVEGKAGLGVGGSRGRRFVRKTFQFFGRRSRVKVRNPNYAPHGVILVLGTADRWTGTRTRRDKSGVKRTRRTGKRRAFRGRVKPNPFIRRAAAASESESKRVIAQETAQGLADFFAKGAS